MARRRRSGGSTAALWVFSAGALLVAWVTSDAARRRAAQSEARASLQEARASLQASPDFLEAEADSLAATPVTAPESPARRRLSRGEVVGRIVAPAVGVDVMAFEGVDRKTLDRGAGHFPGTALPGEPGNASFAAHRDVEFRGLRRVEPGHDIWVDTGEATYVYRVATTRVVEPSKVEVLDAGGWSELTLITCHPFDWVGPAPDRFVVTAYLRGRFDAEDRILDDVLGPASGGR